MKAVLTSPNFLSAFKTLQSAYHTYLRRFGELYERSDWTTLDTLWEQVGEAQKNLSNFGLNVFCNPIPHHPLPDFTQEPQRAIRIDTLQGNCWKTVDLSLDSIGGGTKFGLYKGLLGRRCDVVAAGAPRATFARSRCAADSEAIDLLCKVLTTELGDITERLLSYPETLPEQDAPAGVHLCHKSVS